ncbi:hypothetical protein R6Q59_012755 [Mikania micrantha]
MDEQRLQPVPEVIAGNLVEEMEINAEADVIEEEEVRTEEYDEEFYEMIEAPKFVDFTKPYTVRTDDCYWFCSRVGCDRKHEEEINPEEISKNFVLRVLAARSPNIKLRRALNREHSSIKCPLSAPAKPSKPRIPRFATGSLISDKNGDPQRKIGPCSKVGSTPVPKSRPVAAKYMTTPRNKMCHPNPNAFRSVQNSKTTTVDVPKSRSIAKALVFHSPKKVVVLKKSVELHTPLTKICEGMKRLGISSQKKTLKGSLSKPKKPENETRRQLKNVVVLKKSVELHTPLTKICEGMKRLVIASQKKTLKGSMSKPKKPETEESSRRQLKICRSEKKSKDLVPSKATKTKNKKTPVYKCQSLDEQVVDVKLSDTSASEFSKKEDSHHHETSDASNSHVLRAKMNDLSSTKAKEIIAIAEHHSNEVKIGFEMNDLSNIEDKENMASAEDNSKEIIASAENHSNEVKIEFQLNDLSNIEDKERMVSAEDNSKEIIASAENHSNEVKIEFQSNDLSNIEDKENMVSAKDNSKEIIASAENHSNEVKIAFQLNDLSNIEDKENMVSAEDNSNEVEIGFGSEQIDDGKENALNPQDNRSNNQPLGDKNLSKEMHKKNKVIQTAGPGVTKCKKPKPTSIKPFRLRTDERGILKEAILEKKLHVPTPEKVVTKDTSVLKMTYRIPKNEKFSTSKNCEKEPVLNTARTKRTESTQQRSMTSLKTRSQRKVKMPGQQISVIDEKSSKLPSNVMVEANKSRAVSAARSTSRGKLHVTVPKEPNFHTSHLPRTCSKKIA